MNIRNVDKNKIEIRSFGSLLSTMEEDSRTVRGLAIPVESKSELLAGCFFEIMRSSAVNEDLIKNNDVQLFMNHNANLGTFGRSKFGAGTLKLEITERGLEFSCDIPRTPQGDSMVEGLRRGDIDCVSFGFYVGEDNWDENEDHTYTRSILSIDRLVEISVLSEQAAYPATECALRSLDNFKAELEEKRTNEETKPEEVVEEQPEVQENETTEEDKVEPAEEVQPETEAPETIPEEVPVEQEISQEQQQETTPVEETKNKEDNNKYTNVRKMKENKFSIARILRSKINHENLNDFDQSVLRSAEKLHTEAGLSLTGFAIPFSAITVNAEAEDRAYPVPVTNNELNATLTDTQGKSTIRDEFKGLLDPVFDDNILGEFTILTGLKNNIVFPRHNGVSTAWAEELAEANESTMKFDGVTMSPKRLTSYVTISKQLLIQSDYNIENIVRQELVNSIARKLQTTLFGSQSGTATTPQGLFYNAPSGLPTSTGAYAGLTQIEQAAEEGNIGGELKYIINPSIKQDYRTALKTTGVAGYVYEGGEVLGSPTIVTNSIHGLLYGNLKNVILAQWGSLDITVDDITLAAYGAVRLVVNTYWDIKLINPLTGEGATGTEVPSIIVRVSGE